MSSRPKLSKVAMLKTRCKQSAIIIRALISQVEHANFTHVHDRGSIFAADMLERKKIVSTATEHAEVLEALNGGG